MPEPSGGGIKAKTVALEQAMAVAVAEAMTVVWTRLKEGMTLQLNVPVRYSPAAEVKDTQTCFHCSSCCLFR